MMLEIKYHNKHEALKRVTELADEIISERSSVYQDNWALMSFNSLLYAAAYKIERALYTTESRKKLDDVIDALNYLRFAAIRLLGDEK
ncbi:MAG: hypothetical protein QXN34_06955 [Archaeoglobaceae archaeon]